MRGTVKPRLTYANVVATLALFLALTGGVYAAAKISGAKIKKQTIAGKKLKNDGVTGQQVDEATLGKVPSAENADNATNAATAQTAATAISAQSAASAQTLGGTAPGGFLSSDDVKAFRFDVTVPEGPVGQPAFVQQNVLELGPLKLKAACDRRNDIFQISATTSAASAGIDGGWTITRDNDVDGIAQNSGGGLGATNLVVTSAGGLPTTRRSVGNIVYNDPATVIVISFALFYNASDIPAETRCFFTGTATRTNV